MASIHEVRVVAVGIEEQMQLLFEKMLTNIGVKKIPKSLLEKLTQIHKKAKTKFNDFEFTLDMVSPGTEAGFVSEISSLSLKKHKNGLYTALFAYEEAWRFEYNNFLVLHNQSQHIPMFAIHADESYERGRGSVDILKGSAEEDYDEMDSAFLFLQILKYNPDFNEDIKLDYKDYKKYIIGINGKQVWDDCLEDTKSNFENAIKNALHSESETAKMNPSELEMEIFETGKIELWGGQSAKYYLKNLEKLTTVPQKDKKEKPKRRQGEVIYCKVSFDEGGKLYYYQTEDESIRIGDRVLVPAGPDNYGRRATVEKIEYYEPNKVPFPLSKIKHIVREQSKNPVKGSLLENGTVGTGAKWEIVNGVLLSCSQIPRKVVVPENVVKIGPTAFKGHREIESIKLPETLEEFGVLAFCGCESLSTIKIPKRVRGIAHSCFKDCSQLRSVNLPAGLEIIGEYAFDGCSSLESIEIPDDVRIIRRGAFSRCVRLKTIILPECIKRIDDYAFGDCKSLESIIVPEGVKEISSYCFMDCKSLKNVVLPSSIESIDKSAFNGCENLESISIPDQIKKIENGAFKGCVKLKKNPTSKKLTPAKFREY